MTPSTEILIKRTAYQLAARYREATNTTYVAAPNPTLPDRAQRLPPLRHNQCERLVHAAYSASPLPVDYFRSIWGYVADIAKGQGWSPATAYYDFMSTVFPDLRLPKHTPRNGYDPRGFLCQMLVVAHYRLSVDSQIKVMPDEIILTVQGGWVAALAHHSITWKDGHYLVRQRGLEPINIAAAAEAPLHGQRMLSSEAAALKYGLIRGLPSHQTYIDIFFRCVAMLGDDADFLVREPFHIDITDDNVDQAWEVHSLLEAQRQLRGKR